MKVLKTVRLIKPNKNIPIKNADFKGLLYGNTTSDTRNMLPLRKSSRFGHGVIDPQTRTENLNDMI